MKLQVSHQPQRTPVAAEFAAARLQRYARLELDAPPWVLPTRSRKPSRRARAAELGVSLHKLDVIEGRA